MKTKMKIGMALLMGLMVGSISAQDSASKKLTADEIFPTDRVLDVQITVDPMDWDTIRFQKRGFFEALKESRRFAPPDHPYTYVEASVSIDGIEFPQVAIRKKGFIGSENSTRPSLKIKLNHLDKEGQIDGLTNLTFNNNQQDESLISQVMGYGLFRATGSPVPRCAFAKLTVNGQNLGIYAHVERIHRPLLKRTFGNDDGVLFEGTVVDFNPEWEESFEHKLGPEEVGRNKIRQLIEVLAKPDENIETAIGELVDLDSFYTFWAMESLISFWDGYSGNRNNFFVYLNPETDKFHFIPWGADSVFEKYSPIRNDRSDPVSVKTQGLIAYRLYQLESGRRRYEKTLRNIIERYWDKTALIAETERIEDLVKPYLAETTASELSKEAKGWIEWLRNTSTKERAETLSSEEFKELPAETQKAIINEIEQIEPEGQRERKYHQAKGQFITDWSLLGPFYTRKRNDLDQDFLLQHGGEAYLTANSEQEFHNSKNQTLKWHPISGSRKIINLNQEIDQLDDVTAYAFGTIESPIEEYVEFGLGSDDTAKVWINGNVVYQFRGEGRVLIPDQDRFIVKLNQGPNRCLVKVSQGMGDWGFALRPVSNFPLIEGILLSGQLNLKGENKDYFPLIQIKAIIDLGSGAFSRDWGSLANGGKYQRVIHSAEGASVRLQAVVRDVVLEEQVLKLKSGQEKGVDLIVDTGSPLALKILDWGAAQSASEFTGALEERRQFIKKRRDEIMAEIAGGMPQWESKPARPIVFKKIFGTPIPIENPVGVATFFGSISNGSMIVSAAILLCCFPVFGRKHSMHWYFQALKKYFNFKGRARRKEFWMFQIFNGLIFYTFPILLATLTYKMGENLDLALAVCGLSMGIYGLLTFVPNMAVSVRRMHDINRSAWWLLINLIPVVGWLLTFIWYLFNSDAGKNKYGPNPKLVKQDPAEIHI